MPQQKSTRPGRSERAYSRREKRRRALRAGIDNAPGVTGSGAALGGVAAAGPAGALVGPVAADTARRFLHWSRLDQAFRSTAERFDERERKRAQLTFDAAITGIARHLDAGEGIRDDGFFDPPESENEAPSDAEQLFEGVLRSACESHEHRKAERLGELFVYFVTSQDISPGHANRLVELTKRLTYQQLLLLGLFYEPAEGMLDWTPSGMFTRREIGVTMAIAELAREGLLARKDNALVSSWAQVNPAQMRTVLDGGVLVEAMSLTAAEKEDWEALATTLRYLGVIDADAGKTSLEAVVPPGSAAKRVKIDKTLVSFPEPKVTLSDLPPADQP